MRNLGWTGNHFVDGDELRRIARAAVDAVCLTTMPPSTDALPLRRALATHLGVKPDIITVGTGSTEILHAVLQHFKDLLIVEVVPSFGLVARICERDNRPYLAIQVQESCEITKVLENLPEDKEVLLCVSSPRNPYGDAFSRDQLKSLAHAINGWLLVDQAYVEFGGDDLVGSSLPSNIIIARSLSKAWGLANLRLGYAVWSEMPPAFKEQILPWSISGLDQEVAIGVLARADLVTSSITAMRDEKTRFVQRLREIPGLRVWDSVANFVCFETDAADIIQMDLRRQGIYVTELSQLRTYPREWPSGLRVSIGSRDALEKIVQSASELAVQKVAHAH